MADDANSAEFQQPKIPQEVKNTEVPYQPKAPLIPTPEKQIPSMESLGLRGRLRTEGEIAEVREKLENEKDPYENSTLITKLKERQQQGLPLRIAFLDIDSTLTGTPENQEKARQLLEQKGYAVVFVTSRTEEMAMSKSAYEKSVQLGFTRKEPKLGDDQGKKVQAFADQVESFKGLYDPDIIAATTGARIFVKQEEGGYQTDKEFDTTLKDEADVWRKNTLEVLRHINKHGGSLGLEPIENNETAYNEGDTDVFPPDFRIYLDLIPNKNSEGTGATGGGQKTSEQVKSEGLAKKLEFLQRFRALREDPTLPEELRKHISNIRITNDSNPETGKFAVYLNPKRGLKERAVENVVDKVCKGLSAGEKKVNRNDLELLMAGDSFPDIAMGLYGGIGTETAFLVTGGSRLTDALTLKDIQDFAGEGTSSIKNRMSEKGKGEFYFRIPLKEFYGGSRRVIIGDQAYPGTKSVETVIEYLKNPT